MKLIEFEQALARMRAQGATDDTLVQGFESQDRITPCAGPVTAEQKTRYFTMRDVCFGQRSQEHGGGNVIRCYHYTT